MANTIMRLTIAIAAFALAMCFNIPAGRAGFGDAPWCAMINKGTGEVYLDCQYRTFEECRSAAAADRGFCNVNPAPGPSVPAAVAPPRHHKRHAQQH